MLAVKRLFLVCSVKLNLINSYMNYRLGIPESVTCSHVSDRLQLYIERGEKTNGEARK